MPHTAACPPNAPDAPSPADPISTATSASSSPKVLQSPPSYSPSLSRPMLPPAELLVRTSAKSSDILDAVRLTSAPASGAWLGGCLCQVFLDDSEQNSRRGFIPSFVVQLAATSTSGHVGAGAALGSGRSLDTGGYTGSMWLRRLAATTIRAAPPSAGAKDFDSDSDTFAAGGRNLANRRRSDNSRGTA